MRTFALAFPKKESKKDMPLSSSGPGHHTLTVGIRGSTPLSGTKEKRLMSDGNKQARLVSVVCLAILFEVKDSISVDNVELLHPDGPAHKRHVDFCVVVLGFPLNCRVLAIVYLVAAELTMRLACTRRKVYCWYLLSKEVLPWLPRTSELLRMMCFLGKKKH